MTSLVAPRVPRRPSSYHESTASISSLPTCGYDEDIFVNPPGEDLHCPICMLVLREPYLLSCCGKHLCKVCISRIKNTGSASCPCCRDKDFHSMLNKEKRRVVLGLKIYCANKDKGCTWTGELGEGERHLETRCDYVPKGCPYGCGQLVPKHFLKDHTTHKCTKRPIEVQLESLKQEMTAKLFASETKYEKKIAMLEEMSRQQEEMSRQQEAKIVQQEKKLAIQKEQLFIQAEELKREEINDRTVKDKTRISQVIPSNLTKQGYKDTSTSAYCNHQMDEQRLHVQELYNGFFQAKIPVSKAMLGCIRTLPSSQSGWGNLVSFMRSVEVQKEIMETSIVLKCRCSQAKEKIEEVATRIYSVFSSLYQRQVTFPLGRKNILLQHLAKDYGTGWNNESILRQLECSNSTFIYIGDFADSTDVIVYGTTKNSVDNVCLELLEYIQNEESTAIVKCEALRQLEAFARSKAVMCSLLCDRNDNVVRLIGGKFDVLLVEHYIKDMKI